MKEFLYGRRILITGASSGIGRSCALLFARNGYTVYGVSRNCTEGIESIGTGSIVSMKMDVNDEASIQAAISRMEPLGIVLHCAGFGISGPVEDTPLELVYKQFETNYFGILRVNSYVLPLLRTQKRSLVMAIGSIAGRVPIPFQSHYSSTKYAIEAYFQALRMECAAFGLHSVLIEAGDTKTAFTSRRNSYEDPHSPYTDACRQAVAQMAHDEEHGKSPDSVARVVYRMACRKHPPVRTVVGCGYRVLMILLRIMPDRLAHSIIRCLYHVN